MLDELRKTKELGRPKADDQGRSAENVSQVREPLKLNMRTYCMCLNNLLVIRPIKSWDELLPYRNMVHLPWASSL